MTTTFLSPPPHLLPSSTPHLLNSTALWHPSGQNTSSPPHLHRSLVPPVDKMPPHLLNSTALWHPNGKNTSSTPHSSTPLLSGTPSGQNTSSPPTLLNSAALWYPEWTKYLLTSYPPQLCRSLVPPVDKIPPHLLPSSTPLLSGTPVDKMPPQLHRSRAPQVAPNLLSGAQVDKIPPFLLNFATLWRPKWPPPCSRTTQLGHHALWRPKWCSLAPKWRSLTPSSGSLWRLSWQPPLLSSATSGNTSQMDHILLLLGMLFLVFKIYFFIRMIKFQETITFFYPFVAS